MKSISLIAMVVLFAVSNVSAQKVQPAKSYTVTLTLEQWSQAVGGINYADSLLSASDVPTVRAIPAIQSLSKTIALLTLQINEQLAAEQKAAADTTKKKK